MQTKRKQLQYLPPVAFSHSSGILEQTKAWVEVCPPDAAVTQSLSCLLRYILSNSQPSLDLASNLPPLCKVFMLQILLFQAQTPLFQALVWELLYVLPGDKTREQRKELLRPHGGARQSPKAGWPQSRTFPPPSSPTGAQALEEPRPQPSGAG